MGRCPQWCNEYLIPQCDKIKNISFNLGGGGGGGGGVMGAGDNYLYSKRKQSSCTATLKTGDPKLC